MTCDRVMMPGCGGHLIFYRSTAEQRRRRGELGRMTCGCKMAASVLMLGLTCFPRMPAFVAPVWSPAAATPGGRRNMNRSAHRLQRSKAGGTSGVRRVSVTTDLSMRKTTSSRDETSSSDGSHSESGGPSTRLEFSKGLGAAAAAALVLGNGIVNAAAEDSANPAADAAKITGTGGAEEAAPVAAATSPATAPPTESPLLRELGLEVPYTGKSYPLTKFLGSRATLVVNPKLDDPEALHQVCPLERVVRIGD